ncbi:hypothetical protein, variant [Aphanomyces astaci]|uniref:PIPK domain-containing protein n=1 Tax=Aphanomyces astaci TaxID=112090 RepID=W4FNK8_APHAT|nr:hypothetical protein, variant [Aphanomyces astaci]ETV68434.1 hypothetical protein, variant [Aphanomyces astaci]|eukprot:XP_009842059.1 hypothetical protein, variant [Aphanomyces astaci]
MVAAMAAGSVAVAVLIVLIVATWSTYSPSMMGRDRMDGLTADALATQVGAIVSASSTTFILVRSLGAKEKQYRRHPNPLLFWKAAVDGVYALQLCAQTLHIRLVPAVLSAAMIQSALYASESWFVLISYDLYACGTNPFQNTAYSIRWYHAIAWSVGGVAGLVSWLYIAPSDRDDIVEHARDVIGATEWTLGLFYIYVTLCVLCACVFLLLENQSRPPVGGIKEALRTRSSMLHASRTFTILYGVYQFVAIVLWVLLTLSSVAASWQVHVAFNGLVGARGFMDLVTWHAINSRSFVLHSPSSSLPVDATNRSVSGGSDSFLDGVMSWNPEFNVALRNEVLHFTTRGIVAASLSTTNTASNQSHNYHRRIQLNLHELGMHLRFDSYYPHLFQDVRRGYRLDEASYRESFMSTCHERVGHGGSSGAFMFYTADYLFLVKTITKAERRVLLKMLPAYIQYLKRHPRTHLTRYYGCHAIHMYRQRFYFVVMSNAMGRVSMHQSFDLKGSWINRHAKTTPPGDPEVCTYCGIAFPSGSRLPCGLSIHGMHLPHRVLKDNDLQRKLQLAPSTAHEIVAQLALDSNFLRDQGITDYSLLLSVHTTQFTVDADSIHMTPSSRHQHRHLHHPRHPSSPHSSGYMSTATALCFPVDTTQTATTSSSAVTATCTSSHPVCSCLGTSSGHSRGGSVETTTSSSIVLENCDTVQMASSTRTLTWFACVVADCRFVSPKLPVLDPYCR